MIAKRKKLAREKKLKRDELSGSLILPVVLALIFLGAVGFLAISDWRINEKRTELQLQIQNLQAQLKTLEEKKTQLESGIQQGQSETFLEEQAREKLGLKKPGEEVVSVLPPAENQGTSTPENKNLWQKIIEKLGF